ncbi:hypothetical protein NVP1031O_150 [Vibrio phage 1.031.O._10N.261.46.F8]|nr:hypothetical protein NVP1031O_150 [Vibrio phage 1.031.O._10N.261.46.F8]
MQRFAYADEDLVLVAKADTGSAITITHTLPDKTTVTPVPSMVEDGTTGNFYLTFNRSEVGTHMLELQSTDDPDVQGLSMAVVNFNTSNKDIADAVLAVKTVVDGLATDLSALTTDVSNLQTENTSMDGKVDSIQNKVNTIAAGVGNTVGWV